MYCAGNWQKRRQRCHDTKPLGKGLFCQTVEECAHNAFLGKLGYVPANVMQYQRVAVQGLVYHTQDYKRCKKTCNSFLKSCCSLHLVLGSVYELGDGSCFSVESLSVSSIQMCPISTYANRRPTMWCCCIPKKSGECASLWLLGALCTWQTCQICMNRTNVWLSVGVVIAVLCGCVSDGGVTVQFQEISPNN